MYNIVVIITTINYLDVYLLIFICSLINSSDDRVVKRSASGAVDYGLIPI